MNADPDASVNCDALPTALRVKVALFGIDLIPVVPVELEHTELEATFEPLPAAVVEPNDQKRKTAKI